MAEDLTQQTATEVPPVCGPHSPDAVAVCESAEDSVGAIPQPVQASAVARDWVIGRLLSTVPAVAHFARPTLIWRAVTSSCDL